MLGFSPEVRRLLHATNAIDNLNRGLCKEVKTRGRFPNDQAAHLLYLAIRDIESKAAPIQWRRALNQRDILLGGRVQRVSSEANGNSVACTVCLIVPAGKAASVSTAALKP